MGIRNENIANRVALALEQKDAYNYFNSSNVAEFTKQVVNGELSIEEMKTLFSYVASAWAECQRTRCMIDGLGRLYNRLNERI